MDLDRAGLKKFIILILFYPCPVKGKGRVRV